MATQFDTLREQALRDISANPRPDDFADAMRRAVDNPTEYLRSFQHKDHAELGRLVALEINNALLRRADTEARELARTMGVKP